MSGTLSCIPYDIAVDVLATLRAQAAAELASATDKSPEIAAYYKGQAERITATADAMFNNMTYRSATP